MMIAVLAIARPAFAAAPESLFLTDLTFEQLSEIIVTTASKRSESLANTAAAVSLLQNDDIIRSGATNIPEALRWVPGLNVAQINAAEWAISARGFNGRVANKLLVMVDGRSIYTPLLAGVYWDALNPILEDMDRIEVVRGPGGALWGANAVNGVINLLSKSAKDTQGTLLYASGGSEKQLSTGARVGVALNERSWLRLYAKYDITDDSRWPNRASGHDNWENVQTGFRFDAEPSADTHFTLQGDAFGGERTRLTPLVLPTGYVYAGTPVRTDGANLLGRWTREYSADTRLTVQTYWDHTWRDAVQIQETRNTFDVDAQYDWQAGSRHSLSCGAGYRWSEDATKAGIAGGFDPAEYSFHLFSIFAQDEITLVEQRLKFTLGGKLEHNSFTGFELQPSARLLWTPTDHATFWAGISRAVRTPNRADTGAKFDVYYLPPGPDASNPTPLPLVTRALGNPAIGSEAVVTFETGSRLQVNPTLSVDAAVFFSRYTGLILGIPNEAGTFFEPTPAPAHLILPIGLLNAAGARSYGGELSLTWQPATHVRLMPFYSCLQTIAQRNTVNFRSLATLNDSAPSQQFGLRASCDLSPRLQLDTNLRWVGAVPGYAVASYAEGDLRLAWKISSGLELSVVGQNLFHRQHAEFGAQTVEPRYEIERGVYFKLTWRQ